jgi:CubicO group peptidase (beta-lactamase class C family)
VVNGVGRGRAAAGPAPAAEWATATPAEAGFAADLAERLDAALASGEYDGVHAVVLVRGGRLVYERYLVGDDEKWGNLESGVVFGPDTLHDVRSISKSVVGLLYGIALAEEKVPGPDAPVLDSFPEYADLVGDPARKAITVRHALSMTMGTEWNEDLPYPENSEAAMDHAPDSVRYVLDRPLVASPGEKWVYSSGATEVLGELIARGTGQNVAAYGRDNLFAPLGIEHLEWITNYYGRPYAAGGLRLRPLDAAKIGQLVLAAGKWGESQVVPADWIAAATTSHANVIEYDCGYGYQWWLCKTGGGVPVVEGVGAGGQELLVLPDRDLVLLVTAGLYNDPDAWKRGWGLLEKVVLPALAPQ